MNPKEFAKGVERLVNPVTVGSIHFIQGFNRMLPKFIQKVLITSSSKKIPFMGFVVEPYSLFLCYEIADIEEAKKLLPDGFHLIKTKIFFHDEPKYYAIFGSFRAHTSAFWGVRNEFYIIAEDRKTGLLSWVIIDYDTNTISYDAQSGLRSPNSAQAVLTINHRGTLYADIARDDQTRRLAFEVDTTKGEFMPLDQRLWLEGNLSIGYGKVLSKNNADIFSLKFEPCEVEKALKIPAEALKIEENNWYPGLLKETPSQILCFPYAQHFISDSPGISSNLKNKEELIKSVEKIDFANTPVFSAKSFTTMMIVSSISSFLITLILVLLLIFKN